MRIVVTGSHGFIGKRLVKKLTMLNHDVVEFDLSLGHDITNWGTFKKIDKFDIIVHLAARLFVPDSFTNPRSFYQTNIIGTLNALEACRVHNAKMVFFSSYAYGAPDYLPIDEDHPVKSFNPYSRSKIMGEDICKSYFADFGVKTVIFRPFNIYGPNQDNRFLIPSIINQAKEGTIVLKDKRPKRDYIYVDDIVNAVIKSLNYNPENTDIFNLGSGKSISVEEVVSTVIDITAKPVKVKYLNEYRPNEVLDTIANVTKAKVRLNWEAQISFKEGLRRIIKG
jgi:UDP-glucose 4-epimerase